MRTHEAREAREHLLQEARWALEHAGYNPRETQEYAR